MIDINLLVSEIPQMTAHDRQRVLQAILQSSQDQLQISPSDDMVEIVPIDVPVEAKKIAETGALWISYPYPLSRGNSLQWRCVEVTQAAQEALLGIFAQSRIADELAGRIPPKQGSIQ